MNTPVVTLVFNRPEQTRRLVGQLAEARPPQLFVVADGPRPNKPGEAAKVAEVRALFDRLPWACEVVRNFSDVNLGCAVRVSSGLTWAFQQVEEAIILEDDCIPNHSFFPYAVELLERFREDPRVGSICGTTLGLIPGECSASYRFSRYCAIWGWATWRRAWAHYDFAMTPLKDGSLDAILRRTFPSWRARTYWRTIFRRVSTGKINTWDYRWALSCWKHGLLAVVPSLNMVENQGFGAESSHTRGDIYRLAPVGEMPLPLKHPSHIEADQVADQAIEDRIFSRNLQHRLIWAWRRIRGEFLSVLR